MAQAFEWTGSAGDAWASEWRRTDRSFGGLTDRLLQRTRDFKFNSVLDIGCGAGELSLAIARGRPSARVVGVDISPQLIATSRSRGERLVNAEFACSDAATWKPENGFRPDLLVSRHGVMFFDDPVAAFANLAALAAPGASMLFSCFRGPAENEIFTGIGSLLPPPETTPDPLAPGPMAFADPDRVRAILTAGGWTDVQLEPFDFAMVVGAGEDPVPDAVAYFMAIGPAASRAAEMSDDERNEFLSRLRSFVASKEVDGIVALGAAAWIVSARKA